MNPESRRPHRSEYAAYAHAYVELVEGADILSALRRQLEDTEALLGRADEQLAGRYAYAAGKWTVKDILRHLADSERIFAYRVLALARGEPAALPGFDQEAYGRAGDANAFPLHALLSDLRAARASTIALLEGLPPGAWDRQGDVNGYRVTVRGLAYHLAGHEVHHRRMLQRSYGQVLRAE